MSEFEKPELKSAGHAVTVDDVRTLAGAATPHFSLQVRNRLKRLVAPLAADDPARLLAELDPLQLVAGVLPHVLRELPKTLERVAEEPHGLHELNISEWI